MKEAGILKRLILLALAVAVALAVMAFAASAEEVIAAGDYGQTTIDNVFFRKTASTGGDFWARLPAGWQLKVLGTTTTGTGANRILWYKVQGGTPKAPARTYTGYVHSGYFTAAGEALPTDAPDAEPSATPVPSVPTSSGYVRTVKTGVNIRKTPGGTALTAKDENKIPFNTVLTYTEGPVAFGGYNWVKVSYKGITGYIRSDCWVQTDSNGQAITPSTDTVTPVPVVPDGTDALGTITLTSGGVNFRATPNGSILGRLNKNTKLNYYGTQMVNAKELWYLAYSNEIGSYGYVLGTLAKVTSGATVPPAVTPTPTPGSTPSGATAGTLVTTAGKLNLRKTPSLQAAVLVQIPNPGVSLNFSATRLVGGITWYKVVYNGKTGWLHGSFVRVTSGSSGSATPKPAAPATAVPDPSVLSNIAFTTADKVFIRKEASMSGKQLTSVYKSGTQLTYNLRYQTDTASNPNTVYTWYNVTYNGTTGWMRGDFIRILTQSEKAAYDATGDPEAPAEASYSTLSKGSEGEAVTRLQQALAEQGYLAASEVNGTYTTATEQAVIAFQKAHGLTQDGIAGEKTQHALFNTVPSGTYDGESGSSVTPVLYPVEMVDWFTGDIQDVWLMGGTAVVTDVYTNKSMRMYRIYGGNHADVVPSSAADSAVYFSLFNVSSAQEIDDRQNELQAWRRRPLWVTVGGRTFAASLYPVPHNYSDSAVINANNRLKNNFKGQVCIHFVNSMTHDSKTSKAHVDYDSAKNGNFGHQSAIKYAYTHSISGTK